MNAATALNVVPARADDLTAIARLRDDAADRLLITGIDQWRRGEVGVEELRHRLDAGTLYVARADGLPIATVTVQWEDAMLSDHHRAREPAGYIHTLVVNGDLRGRGIGRRLLRWAEQRIAQEGRHLARLDVVRHNLALRGYYEGAGYRHAGDKDFPAPFHDSALYEKPIAGP